MTRRPWLLAVVVGAILVLTGLHYTAGHDHGATPHHLYRRLYYFPILAAACRSGDNEFLTSRPDAVITKILLAKRRILPQKGLEQYVNNTSERGHCRPSRGVK